jgi:hypothetical protein
LFWLPEQQDTLAMFIVVVQEEEQAKLVHLVFLAEAECLAHQASKSLTQRVVEAFDVIGLTFFFTHGPVLPLGKDGAIRLPEVSVGSLGTVGFGNATPKHTASGFTSVAQSAGDDLPSTTAQCKPNPALVRLTSHKRP